MVRKWTQKEEDKLRKLCFQGKSNADLAKIFNCDVKDIHAARSRLGITINKVKAAKATEVKATPKPVKTTPKQADNRSAVEIAFDDLDLVLLNTAKNNAKNASKYRAAAAGISTMKSLLLGSLK